LIIIIKFINKKIPFFVFAILICIIVVVFIMLNKKPISKKEQFEKLKTNCDEIVDMIKSKDISVNSNGIIPLPEEFIDLSDSGECLLVEYKGKTAIYFYSFRGVLESSKGYLYVTDDLNYIDYIDVDTWASTQNFVNVKKIDKKWFSCSTN